MVVAVEYLDTDCLATEQMVDTTEKAREDMAEVVEDAKEEDVDPDFEVMVKAVVKVVCLVVVVEGMEI